MKRGRGVSLRVLCRGLRNERGVKWLRARLAACHGFACLIYYCVYLGHVSGSHEAESPLMG